ncbi:aminoglycoside phosphotransferase family protein [candidate division KSB1 bacterium]|nr:aminoglycoside phosphotransferase family protein [candidate division KSB1 bacterium]
MVKIQSYTIHPLLVQLEVMLNIFRGKKFIDDHHMWAFYEGDDHQRVRILIEVLSALPSSTVRPPEVDIMREICLCTCPHSSPLARGVIWICEHRQGQMREEKLLCKLAGLEVSHDQWKKLGQFFFPYQLLGERACTPSVRRFLDEKCRTVTGNDRSPGRSVYQRLLILLSQWDYGAKNRPRLTDLVVWVKSLRTDYMKYRAAQELVSRAVQAREIDPLLILIDIGRRRMQKSHRKAGTLAAAAIGLAALGRHELAEDLRLEIWASCLQDDPYGTGERLYIRTCEKAKNKTERSEVLLAMVRNAFPSPSTRKSFDTVQTFSRIIAGFWDTLDKSGQLGLFTLVLHRQIDMFIPGRVLSFPETEQCHYPPVYCKRSPCQTQNSDAPLALWLLGMKAWLDGQKNEAVKKIKAGWVAASQFDRESTCRAAMLIREKMAGLPKPNDKILKLFLQQFKQFRAIPDSYIPGKDLKSVMETKMNKAVERTAERFLADVRQWPSDVSAASLPVEWISKKFKCSLDVLVDELPAQRARVVRCGKQELIVKTDPNGNEARNVRAIHSIIPEAVPKLVFSDYELLAFEFIPGTNLETTDSDKRKRALDKTAYLLARLHAARDTLPGWYLPGNHRLIMRFSHPPLSLDDLTNILLVDQNIDRDSARHQAQLLINCYGDLSTLQSERQYLLHGDIHTGNIIIRNGDRAIFFVDWEDLSIGPLELDLGWLCAGLAESERSIFLNAYEKNTCLPVSHELIDRVIRQRQAHKKIWSLFINYQSRNLA